MHRDAVIAAIARRQYGLVTLRQALDAGFSVDAIRRNIESGRWRRVRRGVFVIGGVAPTWEQSVLAAVLAAGPEAVASHSTAALLWDLPLVEHRSLEISTARPRRARHRGVTVHRTVHFLGVEHTVHRRIPLTTVARTIVDVSGEFSVVQLGRMTDRALRRGTLRLDDLRRCVSALPPAPGRRPRRVQRVLMRRLPGYEPCESDLEMRFLRAIVGAGLPEPVAQYRINLGRRRCRIDLAYPELGLAIEIDGWEPHGTRSAFDEDRARANDLEVAGMHVLRFTSAMSDADVVATVRAALEALGRKRGA